MSPASLPSNFIFLFPVAWRRRNDVSYDGKGRQDLLGRMLNPREEWQHHSVFDLRVTQGSTVKTPFFLRKVEDEDRRLDPETSISWNDECVLLYRFLFIDDISCTSFQDMFSFDSSSGRDQTAPAGCASHMEKSPNVNTSRVRRGGLGDGTRCLIGFINAGDAAFRLIG